MNKSLLLFIFFVSSVFAKENLWFSNEVKYGFNKTTFIFVTYEKRYDQLGFVEGYVDQFSIGADKKIIGNMLLELSYKREVVGDISHENRFVVGLKYKISYFDFRFRVEDRNFEEFSKIDHMNYRFRIRFKYNYDVFRPYLATEPMYNNLTNEFWRNRFYTGVALVIQKQEVFIGYMRQDTKGKDTINALHVGFSLKF